MSDAERIQYLAMVDYVHEWTEWLKHDEVEIVVHFDDAVVQVVIGGIEAMYEDVMSPKWSKIFHTHPNVEIDEDAPFDLAGMITSCSNTSCDSQSRGDNGRCGKCNGSMEGWT
jgi:hypothetical protein